MVVPLQAYKDALPILQTQYDALSLGPYTLKIEPINGLDVFYSDGSAQNYDGKIVLYEKGKDYSYSQYYFRQDLFVDFFLQAVGSAKNSVANLEKTQYFDNKNIKGKIFSQNG